ncbi:hypothetical protein DC3_20060 [Deinococcus cellulosilyticus NBRC 106333 = KACC 11606]|uniref:Uncharacterized protein n=1 Tax=Deinococcus cellulosilyticus (strain DSM 18568 / NBRC 106333 / KACC 11606 / 5516J-15) TaxID=1223518 RepID=A0A511N1Q5_DEIC1|nr:hypothetical protein DC3_20060 [Deinococcus cellulosilyticus NBRC 106333 = KACC 11606]
MPVQGILGQAKVTGQGAHGKGLGSVSFNGLQGGLQDGFGVGFGGLRHHCTVYILTATRYNCTLYIMKLYTVHQSLELS